MSTPRPAVFLDRDGTLNVPLVRDGMPYAPVTVEDFTLLPDVAQQCRRLHAAGYALVVVTNQPEVGRGKLDPRILAEMHKRLQEWIPEIARIEICTAPGRGQLHPENPRRKPEPGMILDAARDMNLDLSRSWMIGDRWRDIDCGHRAGVRTVFINAGYAEVLHSTPDFTVTDFTAAVTTILAADLR